MPKRAPKKKTESKTTTAGNLTTPDIKNGRNIFPSINCKTANANRITNTYGSNPNRASETSNIGNVINTGFSLSLKFNFISSYFFAYNS